MVGMTGLGGNGKGGLSLRFSVTSCGYSGGLVNLNRCFFRKKGPFAMGHERSVNCQSCGKSVQKTGETARIVYFACPCGRTKYSRSKGL